MPKWGVWLDPARAGGAAEAARSAGLVLDTVTTQMGAPLDEIDFDGAPRRGLGRAAMLGALAAARDRGCTTTTLWSAGIARSLYAAIGYRAVGELHLWERRP